MIGQFAIVAFAVAIGVLVASCGGEGVDDVTETVEPESPITASSAQEAIETARAWLTALYAGDVDTALAMISPDPSTADEDRNLVEMSAAWTRIAGAVPTIGDCTSMETSTTTEVDCELVMSDRVWLEVGTETVVAPITVRADQTIVWHSLKDTDSSAANLAYANYLRAFYPAEFEEVCQAGSYALGTVHFDGGLAQNAACAELWAPLADDVVTWLRAGGDT